MVLFVAAILHGQELPNAPQAAVKQQIPPLTKQGPLLAEPGNLYLGSADWFREREHFKLAKVIPLLAHIDWFCGHQTDTLPFAGGSKPRRIHLTSIARAYIRSGGSTIAGISNRQKTTSQIQKFLNEWSSIALF